MNLDFKQKVYDALTENPELKEFMVSIGFEKFKDLEAVKSVAKIMTLEKILSMRGIDKEGFLEKYQGFTYNNETYKWASREESDVVIYGALPCPVKDNIIEEFERNFSELDIKIHTCFQSASLGLDFLGEGVKTIDDFPDIFISVGLEFPFFNEDIKALFNEENFVLNDAPYSENFEKFKDPKRIFHMVAVVPCVFLTVKSGLDEGDCPRSWDELLSDDFDSKITLPLKDLDIVNAVLLTTHSLYGEEAVENIKSRLSNSLHPAEMVKSVLRKKSSRNINIIPYFFGATAVRNNDAELIWPEDGAILSPVLMAFKRKNYDKIKPIVDYFKSDRFAKLVRAGGKFPSTFPGIEHEIPGDFKWIGWDYIYNQRLGEIMKKFEVGLK